MGDNEKQNGTGGSDVPSPSDIPSAPPPMASQASSSGDEMIAQKLADKCLDYFHDSMNNETSRLWQRLIFLGALLGIIFAGYGSALLKFLDCECVFENKFQYNQLLNFVCIGIAFFGVLFSGLWIMMAKGSKAWQKKYEETLFGFIRKNIEKNKPDRNADLEAFANEGFAYGYLRAIDPDNFSNSLVKNKAGAYSVSRINIVLGIISLVFWLIVGGMHSLLISSSGWNALIKFLWAFIHSNYFSPVVFVVLSLGCVWILSRMCKSRDIQNAQDKVTKSENPKSDSYENN